LVCASCGERDASPPPEAPPPVPAERASDHLAGLEDADVEVRVAAAQALAEGAFPLDEAIAPLAAALSDENRYVRSWATRALVRAGEAAAPAVDVLTKALRDRDSFVRWQASQALAGIGPPAASALAELQIAADSEDETELGRYWAREAIRRMRGE
jgi:HEAT repeat protein